MAERMMTSGRRSKCGFRSPRSSTSSLQSESIIQLNVIYKNREHNIQIPEQSDRAKICSEIKKQTGVKGAFYLYNGPKGYLHSSSLTLDNISQICGGRLEIRGGDCKLKLKYFVISGVQGWI